MIPSAPRTLPDAHIFGLGAGGLNCLMYYSSKYNIVGFVDNNKNVRLRHWHKVNIIHATTLAPCDIENKVFIISSMETFTIIDQLVRLSNGVPFRLEFPPPEVVYSPLGRLLSRALIRKG
jgi:hypothetical protein